MLLARRADGPPRRGSSASSTASSDESDWRSLVQRGRLGSPPARTGMDDRRPPAGGPPARGRRARIGRPATSRSAYDASSVPTATPSSSTRTDSSERDRADVAAEPAGHPPIADAEPAGPPPDPRRRPARRRARLGLVGARAAPPARPRGTPGRRRNRPASARPSARICGSARRPRQPTARRAGHADELLADHVERRRDGPQRLDPAGPSGPRRDRRARSARRASPPARARATPHPADAPTVPLAARTAIPRPAGPTCTVRSAVPMSTPSSRLVLRHHRADRARLQPRLDRPAAIGIQRRVVRGDRVQAAQCKTRSVVSEDGLLFRDH